MLTALRLIISGDSAGAVKALEEVEAASDKLAATGDDLAAKNAAAATAGHKGMIAMAAGAGLVAAAIGLCVDQAAKQEEAVIQVEKMTGLGAKGASELVVQMQTLGISADSVAPVLGRMLKNAESYADGATKATSAIGKSFTQLGISVDDLKGKNADQVLELIRNQIAAMPAGIQRTADIMNVFGRSAMTNQGLLRYLTASNSELDEINKKAASFGLIFSQKQLDQAAKFGEMLRVIEMEVKGFAVQVGTAVIPVLTKLLTIMAGVLDAVTWVIDHTGPFKSFFLVFAAVLPGVLMFAFGLMKVVKAVDTLRESMTLMNALQAIFKGRTSESTASTETNSSVLGKNAGAIELNDEARASAVASIGTEDAALATSDESLVANDAALATNDTALETNDALRGGGGLSGASEDLGSVAAGSAGVGEGGAAAGIGEGVGAAGAGAAGGIVLGGLAAQLGLAYLASRGWHPSTKQLSQTEKSIGGMGRGAGENQAIFGGQQSAAAGAVNLHVHLENAIVIGAPSQQAGQQLAELTAPHLGQMFYQASHGSGR